MAHPELREQVDGQFIEYPRAPPKSTPQAHTQPELLSATEKSDDEASSHISRKPTDLHSERNTPIHAPPIIQQTLPENFDSLLEKCTLFYKHSNSSTDLKDEEILHRLQSSKLWDGLTHVFHCGEQDKFERWWAQWSAHIAPEVHEFKKYPNYETQKPVSPFTSNGASVFIPQHIFLDSAGMRRWELAYRGLELDPSGPMFIIIHA